MYKLFIFYKDGHYCTYQNIGIEQLTNTIEKHKDIEAIIAMKTEE